MRVEKGVELLLEEVPLEGAEEVFGLGQGQPEMLDALMVLVEDDDIGDGLFLTLIPTTTSALDMLISLPYVASKDADYP
jgi:hypothetical protein